MFTAKVCRKPDSFPIICSKRGSEPQNLFLIINDISNYLRCVFSLSYLDENFTTFSH